MDPVISLAVDEIVPSLTFSKDCFGIEYASKLDMPLNNPNLSLKIFFQISEKLSAILVSLKSF